jgi:hypothetical protein
MLTAYVDESGQEQDDWMFIAGFCGSEDAGARVAGEWPKAIGPQRKSLHLNNLRFKHEREKRLLRGPVRFLSNADWSQSWEASGRLTTRI